MAITMARRRAGGPARRIRSIETAPPQERERRHDRHDEPQRMMGAESIEAVERRHPDAVDEIDLTGALVAAPPRDGRGHAADPDYQERHPETVDQQPEIRNPRPAESDHRPVRRAHEERRLDAV